jgi:hypothetical protein
MIPQTSTSPDHFQRGTKTMPLQEACAAIVGGTSLPSVPDQAGFRVTCIICAFNEGPRIGAVLAVVSTHPLVDEVIVVDDGSSDQTSAVVAGYPSVRLIVHDENLGKSQAMADGIAAASNDILLFLDADLTGLVASDVSRLIEPVRTRTVIASISMRRNSLKLYRAMGIDFISGERVLPRALLCAHLSTIRALPRFGIEVFINRCILATGGSIAVVDWPSVAHRTKVEKMGWKTGLAGEWRMMCDLFRCIRPHHAIAQAWLLRSRRLPFRGEAATPP